MENKLPVRFSAVRRSPREARPAGSSFSPGDYRLRMSCLSDLFEQADLLAQELQWSRDAFGQKLEAFLAELRNTAEIERAATRLISESLNDVESIRCVESAARRLAAATVPDIAVIKSAFSFDDREEILVIGSARISAASDLIRLLTGRFGGHLHRTGTSRDLLSAKENLMNARRESMLAAWEAVAALTAGYNDLTGPGGRIDSSLADVERELEQHRADSARVNGHNRHGPKSGAE
jgi:hypothetical protein